MYIYILYLYSLLFTGKCRFIIMISLVKAVEENKRRKKNSSQSAEPVVASARVACSYCSEMISLSLGMLLL